LEKLHRFFGHRAKITVLSERFGEFGFKVKELLKQLDLLSF
jgi:hypothetical protein